jgi:hypothetical protein
MNESTIKYYQPTSFLQSLSLLQEILHIVGGNGEGDPGRQIQGVDSDSITVLNTQSLSQYACAYFSVCIDKII